MATPPPPDARWMVTKPLHQPTSPTPPPRAAGGVVPAVDLVVGSVVANATIDTNDSLHHAPHGLACGSPLLQWITSDVLSMGAGTNGGPGGEMTDGAWSMMGDGYGAGSTKSGPHCSSTDSNVCGTGWHVGVGRGTDSCGIGGTNLRPEAPLRAGRSRRSRGGHTAEAVSILGITYVLWTVSAFITFSNDGVVTMRKKRGRRVKPPRNLVGSRRAAARGELQQRRKRQRWLAVAPPMVGRRRLCRRRRWAGRCVAMRVTRAEPRDACRRTRAGRLSGPARHLRGGGGGAASIAATAEASTNGETTGIRRTMAEACRQAMGTLVVGQAANPGPPAALRWVSTKLASAIEYASPHKVGFHGSHTAGLDPADGPPEEPFVLKLATANTTGWRPLQAFLKNTEANVVCAQEHRLLPDSVPAASAWARKNGWKSVWTPAKRGVGGGASAGTAIFTREFIGLRHPERGAAVVAEGHVAAAVVEPPSCRPFIAYAAYLHHGQGLSRPNLALISDIGAHWQSQGDETLQLVIAADFNMRPDVFARSGLASKIWGRVVAPMSPRGTCRTRSGGRTYDYYYMSAAMADLVADIYPIEGTGVRTHAPVMAEFHPRLASLKALALRAPPSLPLDEVYGPRPPPSQMGRPPDGGRTAGGLC